ncbi:MAG: type II toxin-antitoxin system VapC family toxin [Burkholderiales bacterium]
MNLDDLPAGSLCVVDTNVLVYAEQGVSMQAQRFIRRCGSGELKGVLPQPVWQELAHKLMLAEAMVRGFVSGGNPAAKLAAKPEAVRGLTLYRAKVKSLLDLGFGFEPCQLSDLTERAFGLQEKYGLLTNDAVVLAVALRLKADALVSRDKGFGGVDEIELYSPTDLKL